LAFDVAVDLLLPGSLGKAEPVLERRWRNPTNVVRYRRRMTTTEVILLAYMQSPTALAKDRFVNVWHFLDASGGDPAAVAETGAFKVLDFFNGGSQPVGQYMSSETTVLTIIGYDQAAAKPRPELGVITATMFPAGASQNIPEEVALCLSYYTDRNLKSKRGRLYIGPLNVGALTASGEPPRPHAGMQAAFAAAGTRLIATGLPTVAPATVTNTFPDSAGVASTAWALYSPKLGTYAAIEHGWIDDEWDGQSRRRLEATGRVVYP